jgi:hypothetical protein
MSGKKDRFEAKMTGDQKLLCEQTGLRMPCLPFTKRGQAENMLFNRLMIERSQNFDEQEMCLKWVNHCDGKLIFPMLPFYMQAHYKSWTCNQAVWSQVDSTDFKESRKTEKAQHRLCKIIASTPSAGDIENGEQSDSCCPC